MDRISIRVPPPPHTPSKSLSKSCNPSVLRHCKLKMVVSLVMVIFIWFPAVSMFHVWFLWIYWVDYLFHRPVLSPQSNMDVLCFQKTSNTNNCSVFVQSLKIHSLLFSIRANNCTCGGWRAVGGINLHAVVQCLAKLYKTLQPQT